MEPLRDLRLRDLDLLRDRLRRRLLIESSQNASQLLFQFHLRRAQQNLVFQFNLRMIPQNFVFQFNLGAMQQNFVFPFRYHKTMPQSKISFDSYQYKHGFLFLPYYKKLTLISLSCFWIASCNIWCVLLFLVIFKSMLYAKHLCKAFYPSQKTATWCKAKTTVQIFFQKIINFKSWSCWLTYWISNTLRDKQNFISPWPTSPFARPWPWSSPARPWPRSASPRSGGPRALSS